MASKGTEVEVVIIVFVVSAAIFMTLTVGQAVATYRLVTACLFGFELVSIGEGLRQ